MDKKVVIFSSGPIGEKFLEKLLQLNKFIIAYVVICENKNNPYYKGKKDKVTRVSEKYNLKYVFEPDNILDSKYDIGFSFANFHLLKRKHIELFKHGIINFHASPILWYKGSATPVYHIMTNDKSKWGYSYHYITEELDQGPIIEQVIYDIKSGLTSEEIDKTSAKKAVESLDEFLIKLEKNNYEFSELYENNKLKPIKRSELDMLADTKISIEDISLEPLFRAFNWPKIVNHPYIEINKKKYRIIDDISYNEIIEIYRKNI